jgi:hypothetical protein
MSRDQLLTLLNILHPEEVEQLKMVLRGQHQNQEISERVNQILKHSTVKDLEQLKELLFGSKTDQPGDLNSTPEIGSDDERIVTPRGKVFKRKHIKIDEIEGKLGRIHDIQVYFCGHSPENNPSYVVDIFEHIVCSDCIRWCSPGRHFCCRRDSKQLSNGDYACDYHRGIRKFLRKPKFIKD